MDRASQLRRFIEQKPDDPFPRYALALELKSAGDAAASAAELETLVARKPDYLPAYLMLGMQLSALGRAPEARRALETGQAVARTQGNSHTLSELTTALEQLGPA